MRDDRVFRILRPALALLALAALLVALGMAITGPASASTKSSEPKATKTPKAERTRTPTPVASPTGGIVLQRGAQVRFGEDVSVPKGARVPSVVVFGGNVVVNGRVTDSVVAFGGDVTINGRVGTSTVAFGGDVTLGPNAVVGRALGTNDAALVLFGGNLTRAPGAQVNGQIQQFDGLNIGEAFGWIGRGMLFSPLLGLSFVGWLIQTAFFLVLALVAAALMPKQLKALQTQLARRPLAALGWGALTFFVAAPATLIVLVISVIGLLLVLPYVVFVLLAYFFVTTGVAAFVAQRIIRGFGGKENLMLAVTLGVVGTTLVSRVPVVGPLILVAMMVLGAGAAILGVAEWRRARREEAAARAAAAPPYPASGGATVPPAVITPIVQTSPAQQQAAQAGAVPSTPPQPPQPPRTPEARPPEQEPQRAAQPAVTPDAQLPEPQPPTPQPAPQPPTPQPPETPEAPATPPAPDAPQGEPGGGERPEQTS